MFFARWLLGYRAREWWDMPAKERIAYERGMREWLPHILYGSDAIERDRVGSPSANTKPVPLSALPGGDIVRAV